MSLLNKILGMFNKLPLSFMQKEAKKRFVTDTFQNNKRGSDKMNDLDSYNMESYLPYYIMPSMMYTFMYPQDDIKIGEQMFSDLMPIILCTESKPTYLSGIDVNLMTMQMKEQFIWGLDEMFEHFYSETVPDIWYDKEQLVVNEKLANLFASTDGIANFLTMMSERIGCDISYCYRRYDISKVMNIHFIEYSDYPYIPAMDTSESLEKYDAKAAFILANIKSPEKLKGNINSIIKKANKLLK